MCEGSVNYELKFEPRSGNTIRHINAPRAELFQGSDGRFQGGLSFRTVVSTFFLVCLPI